MRHQPVGVDARGRDLRLRAVAAVLGAQTGARVLQHADLDALAPAVLAHGEGRGEELGEAVVRRAEDGVGLVARQRVTGQRACGEGRVGADGRDLAHAGAGHGRRLYQRRGRAQPDRPSARSAPSGRPGEARIARGRRRAQRAHDHLARDAQLAERRRGGAADAGIGIAREPRGEQLRRASERPPSPGSCGRRSRARPGERRDRGRRAGHAPSAERPARRDRAGSRGTSCARSPTPPRARRGSRRAPPGAHARSCTRAPPPPSAGRRRRARGSRAPRARARVPAAAPVRGCRRLPSAGVRRHRRVPRAACRAGLPPRASSVARISAARRCSLRRCAGERRHQRARDAARRPARSPRRAAAPRAARSASRRAAASPVAAVDEGGTVRRRGAHATGVLAHGADQQRAQRPAGRARGDSRGCRRARARPRWRSRRPSPDRRRSPPRSSGTRYAGAMKSPLSASAATRPSATRAAAVTWPRMPCTVTGAPGSSDGGATHLGLTDAGVEQRGHRRIELRDLALEGLGVAGRDLRAERAEIACRRVAPRCRRARMRRGTWSRRARRGGSGSGRRDRDDRGAPPCRRTTRRVRRWPGTGSAPAAVSRKLSWASGRRRTVIVSRPG